MTPPLLEIHSELPDAVLRARVLPGRTIACWPRCDLRTVSLGVARSSHAYRAHLADTFGSSFDFGDELRFARGDHGLLSAVLTLPERNAEEPDALVATWLDAPRAEGLVALEAIADFNLGPCDIRAASRDARSLVAVLQATPPGASERLRLAVAPGLELLFADGRYVGLHLAQPTAHLVPLGAPPSAEAMSLLVAYLDLVAEPNLEQMADGDRALERAILALADRAAALGPGDAAAQAIAAAARVAHDNLY